MLAEYISLWIFLILRVRIGSIWWSGRGFLPGAFSSAKPIWPSGSKIRRSGIPAKEGHTSLSAMPLFFFTAIVNLFSICFSIIANLRQALISGDVQGVSMVFTKLFLRAIFLDLREFLYKTLIHLVIVPDYCRKSSSAPLSS